MNDDDLSRKIKQIAELLGQDSMPDSVKGLLSVLSGSLSGNEGTAAADTGQEPRRTEEQDYSVERMPAEKVLPAGEGAGTDDMMRKVRQVMDRLNTGNDPRINLLHAIKPFMAGKRQQKISNCIRILQLISMTRLLDNNEK